jgi:hypothetical protein
LKPEIVFAMGSPDRIRLFTARRIVIGLGTLCALLIVLTGWAFFFGDLPLGGGVRLGTAVDEPDLEIYVDDRLVGVREGFVTWREVLGMDGQEPLGILLPDDARPMPVEPEQIEQAVAADAELLADTGAAVLSVEMGNPMMESYSSGHDFARYEILLRRGDGRLDQVFCLEGRLRDYYGRTHRVLVPIRVRRRGGSTDSYFTSEARSSGGGRFANFFHRVTPEWNFESTDPPPDVAAEIAEKGLWTPGR